MLNFVEEKEENEGHDRSRSSFTRPWIVTPMGFVRRFGLDFGL